MRTVISYLQITPEEYENMYIESFMRWCMDLSINYENDLQKVLANSAISKWYLAEWKKCEQEFLKCMHRRQQTLRPISKLDAQSIYNHSTFNMFNLRPKGLLNDAKKLNIFNDTTAN